MRLLVIGMSLLAATSALAQSASPNEQAMGVKLLQEIQAGLSCSANLISAQADLAKAQTRIKELEAKSAPSEEKDKPQ